jgi:hypothetical protein
MTGLGENSTDFPGFVYPQFPPASHVVYGIPPTSETAYDRCADGQSIQSH